MKMRANEFDWIKKEVKLAREMRSCSFETGQRLCFGETVAGFVSQHLITGLDKFYAF
ncbi:hypothetical protein QJS04_geneDACA004805 [Acorus gramineus]|uniref:Uncharacterized protein n=1 Tax=Acorus gramineus TaxID=55184 RepID=A0AAV9BXY8_ACOGR|nr:hypothetical protein QJS04_geneDACA004805 [Acorus gramineus]